VAKQPTPQDPNFKREAQKYDNPIPSREFILEHLEKRAAPANHKVLCIELALESDDHIEALRRRLRAMERDGQLVYTRRGAYAPLQEMELIKGRVQGHRDGYGFLVPEDGSDDLYLHNRQMRRVFDGDIASARVSGADKKGRREGAIIDVLERNTTTLVGRFYTQAEKSFVTPDNNRVGQDIFIDQSSTLGAQNSQYVTVEIIEQPGPRNRPTGKITEVLGDHMAPGMEIDVAMRSHDIPFEWPSALQAELESIPEEVVESDKATRIDLRNKAFVTIDGEDARDFDDAVYCEAKKGGGWRLFVAIADVSHYVQVGSALDTEAQLRGNSVYFPSQVIPMLPEKISNGLCSLNPHVDRLVMVAEMTISAAGRLSGYTFYEGIIHSHARLTYTKVGHMLEKTNNEICEQLRTEYAPVVPHVDELYRLYHALRGARDVRGAIDFDTVETRIIFGEDRKIEDIVPVERNDAHKLIEECMLCANVSAARFIENQGLEGLYRVHEGPKEQKLKNLRDFLGELGLELSGLGKPKSKDYQTLLASIKDRPDANVIQTVMLRSLSQAVYQPDNKGHFGLGYTGYTHFTSPIRRYPDLLTHRAIRSVIRSTQESDKVQRVEGVDSIPKKHIYPYDLSALLAFGEQSSMTERRADDATRDVMDFLKCEYIQDHIGDEFTGIITAVTGFGIFVELKDVYVEGLVHVTGLGNDFYQFDAAKHRLVGERSGNVYRLGDEVKVRVVRVDLDDKKIDLELAENDPRPMKKSKKTGSKKSKSDAEISDEAKKPSRKKDSDKEKGTSKPRRRKAKAPTAKVKKEGTEKTTKKMAKKQANTTPAKSKKKTGK
jgi:ribonuclease R